MGTATEVTAQSPVDTELARLEDDVKTVKKAINRLCERLNPVLASVAPTEESKNPQRDSDCYLLGKIFAMQRIAEESDLLITNLTERLQI